MMTEINSMEIKEVENGFRVSAKGHKFVAKTWEDIDCNWISVSGTADATKMCRNVIIEKAENGFIAKVDCIEFIACSWKELDDMLQEYWKDPMGTEAKYCEKTRQLLATLVDKEDIPPLTTYEEKIGND